jgi:hypothetical protein
MKTIKNNKDLAKAAIIWRFWKRGDPLAYWFPKEQYFYKGHIVCISPYEMKEYISKRGLKFKDLLEKDIQYQIERLGIKPVPIFWAVALSPMLLLFAFFIRKYYYLRYYLWNKIKCRTQSLYWRLRGEIECLKDEIIWRDIEVEYPAIKYPDNTAWGSDVVLILDNPQYRKSDGTFAEPPSRVNTFLGFRSKPGKVTKVKIRGKRNILTREVRLVECLSHTPGCLFDFYLASTGKMIVLK